MKRAQALFATALVLLFPATVLHADISMPVKDNFYDKAGRGIANIAFAPAELLDSHYSLLETEGDTVAFTKGFIVQGTSRAIMDIGTGVYDLFTSPFPTNNNSYRTMKQAPYNSMIVNDYPPADLKNWY